MNAAEYQLVLGRRIAQERRRHGLSQPELAALLDRPVSWLSQVERGVQPVDRLSVLKTLADALELPLAELTAGNPEPAARQPAGDSDRLLVVLSGAHALSAMLGEVAPPSLAQLRAGTDRACALARTARYDELADVLGDLLPGLEAAARNVPDSQQADVCELMAVAYQACSAALAKLGRCDAAWIAADRAMAAAERAGNLLLVAAGAYRLASVFLDARRYLLAEETARTAAAALRSLAELGDPDAIALCGGLTLLRAAAAARTNHASAAYGHLARARHLAARLGEHQANGAPEFGCQQVALYEIAVSVDLGDAGHALRASAAISTAGLSPSRHARMLIDVARAHAQRRQVSEAVTALLRAEAVQSGRFSDTGRVRQVIAELLAIAEPVPDSLRELAVRVGAPPPPAAGDGAGQDGACRDGADQYGAGQAATV